MAVQKDVGHYIAVDYISNKKYDKSWRIAGRDRYRVTGPNKTD